MFFLFTRAKSKCTVKRQNSRASNHLTEWSLWAKLTELPHYWCHFVCWLNALEFSPDPVQEILSLPFLWGPSSWLKAKGISTIVLFSLKSGFYPLLLVPQESFWLFHGYCANSWGELPYGWMEIFSRKKDASCFWGVSHNKTSHKSPFGVWLPYQSPFKKEQWQIQLHYPCPTSSLVTSFSLMTQSSDWLSGWLCLQLKPHPVTGSPGSLCSLHGDSTLTT